MMSGILREIAPDRFVLNIPEKDNLLKSLQECRKSKEDEKSCSLLNDAYVNYLKWLKEYSKNELKNKSFAVDDVASIVFETKPITKRQNKEKFFRYSLFILGLYADDLMNRPNTNKKIVRYETLVYNLLSDAENVIAGYIELKLHDNQAVELCIGSRPNIEPDEILRACCQLFYIEEAISIDELDVRNLKPYMVFNIRQLLERVGENIIGYAQITDNNDKPIHKFTQIAWEFLEERNTKGGWELKLPYSIKTISKINKWTNSFVHPAYIMRSYLQFYALYIMRDFMHPAKITMNNGKSAWRLEHGDFRIEHYSNLKSDFDNYIAQKMRENRSAYKIHWLKPEEVGAYIMSM